VSIEGVSCQRTFQYGILVVVSTSRYLSYFRPRFTYISPGVVSAKMHCVCW